MVAKPAAAKKGAKKPAQKVQKTIKKDTSKKSNAMDVDIDEDARYNGEVVYYNRNKGFGFIKVEEEGVVPEDKVMVHWQEIQTSDRWPYLVQGLKVEFGLKKTNRNTELRAKEVSQPGGEQIALLDERDEKLEFVGDKNTRYLGNVKFYDAGKGFGYVKLQEGYDIDEGVPQEFRISRSEINSGDDAARLNKDMEIEFGIMKNKKGVYGCYNITLPGGDDISRVVVEGRKDVSKATFKGKIAMWAFQKGGFGYIEPESAGKFPANFKKAIKEDAEKRAKRAEKKGKKNEENETIYFRKSDGSEAKFSKGQEVSFKLYTDSMGVGACEVTLC